MKYNIDKSMIIFTYYMKLKFESLKDIFIIIIFQ
jgi:hypothetical protein